MIDGPERTGSVFEDVPPFSIGIVGDDIEGSNSLEPRDLRGTEREEIGAGSWGHKELEGPNPLGPVPHDGRRNARPTEELTEQAARILSLVKSAGRKIVEGRLTPAWFVDPNAMTCIRVLETRQESIIGAFTNQTQPGDLGLLQKSKDIERFGRPAAFQPLL